MARRKQTPSDLVWKEFDISSLDSFEPAAPGPPAETRPTTLPFQDLSWALFEYAAYRLARSMGDVQHAARLGRPGQKQHGIDLFVFTDGAYHSWQTKHWKKFGPSDVVNAVKKFRDGKWAERSSRFVLCVSCDLNDERTQEEIERQRGILQGEGKTLCVWDRQELSELLRSRAELVDDLFGRNWVSAFVGGIAASQLESRVSAHSLAAVREFLKAEYAARFATLDSSAGSLQLERPSADDPRVRVVRPDVEISGQDSNADGLSRNPSQTREQVEQLATKPIRDDDVWDLPSTTASLAVARTDLDEHLASNTRSILLGHAGFGKSTLLRCLAADLVSSPMVFPKTVASMQGAIPILLPFSFWVRLAEAEKRPVGLEEAVRLFFQGTAQATPDIVAQLVALLGDRRCIILIDGLDEFSSSAAARTTLHSLETFAERTGLRVVATGRPEGVYQLGGCYSWAKATVLELTPEQRRLVARRWWETLVKPHHLASTSLSRELWIERFFEQLGRTGNIEAISGAPLILVASLVVALHRGGALPSDRFEIFHLLVDIFIRVQPNRRELEAAETSPRRTAFQDDDLPVQCLSRLAFEMIRLGAGAGMTRLQAQKIVIAFLEGDAAGWTPEKARLGADELLGARADTSGLIVERAPGELGFLHAALRDHLAGRHLQSRPFDEILSIARDNCHTKRWHQALLSCLFYTSRPNEIETFLATIHGAVGSGGSDAGLLVAAAACHFGTRAQVLAATILEDVADQIERGPNFAVRAELLGHLLDTKQNGPAHRVLSSRLAKWMPRATSWYPDFFQSTKNWPREPALLNALLSGLEGDISHRDAATQALTTVYARDEHTGQNLLKRLKAAESPAMFAATMNALVRGWPDLPGVGRLLEESVRSDSIDVRAAAAVLMVNRGEASDELLDTLLDATIDRFHSGIAKHELVDALVKGWPGDQVVMRAAWEGSGVRSLGGQRGWMERDIGDEILLRSAQFDPRIIDWLVEGIRSNTRPFITLRTLDGPTPVLARLAEQYSTVRDTITDWLADRSDQLSRETALWAAVLRSEPALEKLLRQLPNSGEMSFWPVSALVTGWGRSHAAAGRALQEIANGPVEQRQFIAEYLPDLVDDKAACRKMLLEAIAAPGFYRPDFVIRGFAKLGVASNDDEIVSALMPHVPGPRYFETGVDPLIEVFHDHPRVREFALSKLEGRYPPLGSIAKAYAKDPLVRARALERVQSLPASFRRKIAQRAVEQPHNPMFAALLAQYDTDIDPDVRALLVVAQAERTSGAPDKAQEFDRECRKLLTATGPEMEVRRVTGLVGLLARDQLEAILQLQPDVSGVQSNFDLLGPIRRNGEATAFVASRWERVEQVFGDEWRTRLARWQPNDFDLWQRMAPYIWRSPALQQRFLEYCSSEDVAHSAQSLGALARMRPQSEFLKAACQSALRPEGRSPLGSPFDRRCAQFQALVLLVDHFGQEASSAIRSSLEPHQIELKTIGLSLLHPADEHIKRLADQMTETTAWDSWPEFVAVCPLASPEMMSIGLIKYLTRPDGSIWDFPNMCRRILISALSQRQDARPLLLMLLREHPSADVKLGAAELFASVHGVDGDLIRGITEVEQAETSSFTWQRFARSVVDDQRRPLIAALSELWSSG